jgi:hypothetical protein
VKEKCIICDKSYHSEEFCN